MIPIARVELADDEIEAAVAVLKSGHLIQGEEVARFEKDFAAKVGSQYAIAVSSGTAALHIAYFSVLKPGDEVILPSFTHISTASMVIFAGGKPVFCDVDSRTFNLDVTDAQKRVTGKTAAIAPVHLYGNACDIDGIRALARDYNLKIVWDAAQAHGTKYHDQDVGSFDDLVCYSFYPTKNMTTGEGGMITTNDPQLAEKCRLLRSHWQTDKYYHPGLGFNYRMTDMAGAIGVQQLKKLDNAISQRRRNAKYLTEHLSGIPGIKPPTISEGVFHSFHQYTILLDLTELVIDRDNFAKKLLEHGIGTGIHYPRPLHLQPAFGSLTGEVCLPLAETLAQRVLSLPVHPSLIPEELQCIVEAVKSTVSTHSL